MSKKQVGSGGLIERAIWFFAGCVMAGIGAALAYYCYKWMNGREFAYRWVWIAGSAGLALVLLRGAWFTIFPEEVEEKIVYNTGGR